MAINVFISWSGELSGKLARAIREWLPGTLQFVKPYFTSSDIEKGAKWQSDISDQLEKSDVGIICLTSDNLGNPWILFEAGALSKNLSQSRVCTLLFDVAPTDVTGPLALFQHTEFKKESFRKLIETINNAETDSKLDDTVRGSVFEKWWPDIEEKVTKILTEHKDTTTTERDQRSERDLLEEILESIRSHVRHGQTDKKVSDVLPVMAKLIGTNAEKLDRVYSAIVGPIKPTLKMTYADLMNLADQAKAEVVDKKTSLTTTQLPESDS